MFDIEDALKAIFYFGAAFATIATTIFLVGWGVCALVRWLV